MLSVTCTAGKIITFIAILASDLNYRVCFEIVEVPLGKIDYSDLYFVLAFVCLHVIKIIECYFSLFLGFINIFLKK